MLKRDTITAPEIADEIQMSVVRREPMTWEREEMLRLRARCAALGAKLSDFNREHQKVREALVKALKSRSIYSTLGMVEELVRQRAEAWKEIEHLRAKKAGQFRPGHSHQATNIQHLLKNFEFPNDFRELLKSASGNWLDPGAARNELIDRLARGEKVISLLGECEGFDPQTGCPGHRKEPHAL